MTDPETSFTRLVLIRHAEPEAHRLGVVAGRQGDTGLSELGVKQAESLRDRLTATGELDGADVLISSPLPRARETAEIVAPALGDLPVVIDDEVEEWRFGDADGMTWDEFAELHPIPHSGWSPFLNRAPGDESWAELQLRIQRRLWQLAMQHSGRTVVISCHGGVITASMVGMAGLSHWGATVWLRPDYTSLTEWALRDEDVADMRPPKWTLRRYNDAAHLAGQDLGVIHPLP